MNKFRPQGFNGRFVIRERRRGNSVAKYHWQTRIRWYRDSDRHRKHLLRVFEQLHYLGSHAPAPIRKRWHDTEMRFINQRVPVKASMRYLETHSSGRWL